MNILEEIQNNSGLNESNQKRREFKKLAKEYSPNVAGSIMKVRESTEKTKIVENPIQYATSNPKFMEAVKNFYKKPEMKPSDIKEKFMYYDKKTNTVSPGSWDEDYHPTIEDVLNEGILEKAVSAISKKIPKEKEKQFIEKAIIPFLAGTSDKRRKMVKAYIDARRYGKMGHTGGKAELMKHADSTSDKDAISILAKLSKYDDTLKRLF